MHVKITYFQVTKIYVVHVRAIKMLYSNMINQLLHIYKYFNHILLYFLVKNNSIFLNVFIVGSSRCQYLTLQHANFF